MKTFMNIYYLILNEGCRKWMKQKLNHLASFDIISLRWNATQFQSLLFATKVQFYSQLKKIYLETPFHFGWHKIDTENSSSLNVVGIKVLRQSNL